MIDNADLIARLALALACGLALGTEREARSKVAGVRTHALVAVGAALFSIAGAYGLAEPSDPTRIAAQVASGIGFIGAGAILRSGFTVTGITTASTLWLAAALGVASGLGLYLVAIAALAMALLLITVLGVLMAYLPWTRSHQIELRYRTGYGTLGPLFAAIVDKGMIVRNMQLNEHEDGNRDVQLTVSGGSTAAVGHVVSDIVRREEVMSATFTR